MSKNTKIFGARLATTLVVAVGIGLGWAFALAWLSEIYTSTVATNNNPYESIVFDAATGRPFIQYYVRGPLNEYRYRTLEGVERKANFLTLTQSTLAGKRRNAPWTPTPPWSNRLLWLADVPDDQAKTLWYAINDPQGRCRLAGYGLLSRRPAGSIGRRGFEAAPPQVDERFQVNDQELSMQFVGWGVNRSEHLSGWSEQFRLARGLAYVLDDGKLIEVNVRKRTVRTLLDEPGGLSTAMATYYQRDPKNDDRNDAEDEESPDTYGVVRRPCVVVRYPDRLVYLATDDKTRVDFPIPEDWRDEQHLTAARIDETTAWLTTGLPNSGVARQITLRRIDVDGKQLEEANVRLAGYVPPTWREWALLGTPAAPAPIVGLIGVLLIPLEDVWSGVGTTYGPLLRQAIIDVWPALAITALAGAASAAAVVRVQRWHYRDHIWVWAVAALLCGPAFVAAYLAAHRGDVLAVCGGCRRSVPVKRRACAACGTPFPSPALKGTEVFA